ncbi:Hypothetical predicted protein, partial [Mytilus galloprovincialis]
TMRKSLHSYSFSASNFLKRSSLILSPNMELVFISILCIIPSVLGAVVPFPSGATDLLKVANIETKISGTQDGMCPGRDVAYPLTGSEELNFQLQDAFP